jgi:hypothetical protein
MVITDVGMVNSTWVTKVMKEVQQISVAIGIFSKINLFQCFKTVFQTKTQWAVIDSETTDIQTYLATGPVGHNIAFIG